MITFIIEIIIGVLLAGVSFIISSDYYSTLLFSLGFAFAFSASIQLARFIYWKNPKRKDAYEAKVKKIRINSIDERKQLLRMKSGHITYQIMTWLLLAISFILALFHIEWWVIAIFFLLFILSWIIGIIVYHRLEKRL